MSLIRLACLLLVALGAPACLESGEVTPTPFRVPTGCDGVAACPMGLLCEAGACVGGSAPSRALVARVRPPRSSGAGAVEIRGIVFDDSPVLEISGTELPTTVDLEAVLSFQGEPISARAVARPQGVVDPVPLEVSAEPVNQGEGPRTRLPLVPWWPRITQDRLAIRYDIQFTPLASPPDDLPPWSVLGVSVQGGVGAVQRAFELPGAESLLVLNGQLALSPELPTPLQGVTLFALDAAGRRVSTEAVTDEEGRFALKFWRPARDTEVSLRVLPSRPDRPLPELEVPVVLPLEGDLEFLPVFLGNVGTLVNFTGTLEGTFGDITRTVPGASLQFVGAVSGGRYETWALSGVDGAFTAQLYPGVYQVAIAPPLSDDFRYTRARLEVSPVQPGDPVDPLNLTVRPRSRVFGQLVAPDGAPLPQGRVTAELMAPAAADPTLSLDDIEPAIREVSALADDEGRFELFLDPGAHRLSIRPPVGQGLPTLVTEAVVPVEQTTGQELRTLEVPPAVALSLTLVTEDGLPLEDAVVEVWWDDPEGRERAGQGASDADGQVQIRLPNSEPLVPSSENLGSEGLGPEGEAPQAP